MLQSFVIKKLAHVARWALFLSHWVPDWYKSFTFYQHSFEEYIIELNYHDVNFIKWTLIFEAFK